MTPEQLNDPLVLQFELGKALAEISRLQAECREKDDALSRIDYITGGTTQSFEVSDYDGDFDARRVVRAVESKMKRIAELEAACRAKKTRKGKKSKKIKVSGAYVWIARANRK